MGNGDWSNFNIVSDSEFQGFAFGTAMMLVMFAYSGWNASAYIAGEIKNPRKNLPRSLITGTLIVTFLYLGINLFIFYALPYQQAAGVEAIVEAASINAFGNWMGRTLGVLIAIGLLSSISAFIMIGPRIYFAMARDKLFFSFAGKVHPKYQVPGKSILIQGSIAVLMVVFSSIEQLVIYLIYALNIFSWLAVASLFIARKRNIGETRAAKVPAYPFIPLFFLTSSFILMIFAYINRPLESTTAIITILIGVPIYYLWKRGGINFGVK